MLIFFLIPGTQHNAWHSTRQASVFEGLTNQHSSGICLTYIISALATVLWTWYDRHNFAYEDTAQKECTQIDLIRMWHNWALNQDI